MVNFFKAFLLKILPFKTLDRLRTIRGIAELFLARYLPSIFLPLRYRSIKARLFQDYSSKNLDDWNKAFLEYSSSGVFTTYLMWADRPSPGNFGDWLSPYIFHKISSNKVIHVPDYGNFERKHIVGIGSIACKINKYSHVFGTGIHTIKDNINPGANFHFVRGPYTRKRLIECGGRKVDIFGDMGFVMSKLYPKKLLEEQYEVLLVRHLIHQDLPLNLPEYIHEFPINASGSQSIESFIDKILGSRVVITSAMHCYIVCKSYGIPCALIDFKDAKRNLFGDGIKFLDAMAGAGLKEINPHKVGFDLQKENIDYLVNDDNPSQLFIDDLFEHIQSSIENFRNTPT